MSFIFEDRLSDSPHIEGIAGVRFEHDYVPLCRADGRWELVVKTHQGIKSLIVAGPMTKASATLNLEGSEYIVIKFKLGTFMPYLPARNFLDAETTLPEARRNAVWLSGSVWQLPDYHNVETFVERLVHEEALARDRVFVVTHHAHEKIVKEGGTTFFFVTDGIESALEQATAAAGGKDVAVGGGANLIQQFIKAGLLDEIQIHIAHVLLGEGRRLFEQMGTAHRELEKISVVESPGVTHLRFRVVKER